MKLFYFSVTAVFLIFMILWFTMIEPFLDERTRIKMEIGRTEGKERQYWEKELKKLYLRLIPFKGRFK